MAKQQNSNVNSNGGGRKARLATWRKTAAKGRRGDKRKGLRNLVTGKTADVPF